MSSLQHSIEPFPFTGEGKDYKADNLNDQNGQGNSVANQRVSALSKGSSDDPATAGCCPRGILGPKGHIF